MSRAAVPECRTLPAGASAALPLPSMSRWPVTQWVAWLTVGLCIASLGTASADNGSGEEFSPGSVRRAARAAGLDSLARVAVPLPSNLFHFVCNTADGMVAARQLGKALFWDMQVGSDGQACASCHFHAGADNRIKNQLNPGVNAGDSIFGNPGAGVLASSGHPWFGPSYALEPRDFPFHRVDPEGPQEGWIVSTSHW